MDVSVSAPSNEVHDLDDVVFVDDSQAVSGLLHDCEVVLDSNATGIDVQLCQQVGHRYGT